jgi:SET domain-containing protein
MDKYSSIPFEVKSSSVAGLGAFATVAIRGGDTVIEYIGERISKQESLKRCIDGNNYIFQIDDEFDIDGSIEANLARFINHSCAPNAEAQLDGEHVWIIALRDIAPGEEISFNYGYDLEDYREHRCNCGAPNCFGYILAEEFWGVARQPDAELSDPLSQPEQEQFAASRSD